MHSFSRSPLLWVTTTLKNLNLVFQGAIYFSLCNKLKNLLDQTNSNALLHIPERFTVHFNQEVHDAFNVQRMISQNIIQIIGGAAENLGQHALRLRCCSYATVQTVFFFVRNELFSHDAWSIDKYAYAIQHYLPRQSIPCPTVLR